MNFLLLHRDELRDDGTAQLSGRRAAHARTVLRVAPGQALRAGIVDGPLGTATVVDVGEQTITVALCCEQPAPASGDVLLLAVPRPKVLLRMLAHAAALGAAHLVLCRSWRVEKSHLLATSMQPEVWREQLLLGLEQAGRTALPRVTFCPLFKPMVEDLLPTLALPPLRFVAHPAAATPVAHLSLPTALPFALALGPDGGWLPYEVQALAAAGFHAISAGPHPLRTETALGVLWGQLDLLRQRGSLGR